MHWSIYIILIVILICFLFPRGIGKQIGGKNSLKTKDDEKNRKNCDEII